MISVASLNPAATPGLSGAAPFDETQPKFGGAKFSFKLPQAPAHIAMPTAENAVSGTQIAEPTSWGQMLQRMASDTNVAQTSANDKIRDIAAGGATPVHEAMIAMQEANLRFSLLSEVRNKMLEAYQEIMRMQV